MMRVLNRNRDLRRTIICMVFLFILGLIFWGTYAGQIFGRMNKESFSAYAALYGQIKEQYPDFDEASWIAWLNGQGNEAYGEALLEKYGISDDSPILKSWQSEQMRLFITGILALAGVAFCFLICLLFYLYKRQKQIDALITYMKKVEQGEYRLDLSENDEDELSLLKNELYKITVLLKESSQLAGRQKKALADSVSDISHQLKTPLTSVTVLLDNLSDNPQMEEETRKRFLAEITRQLSSVNWMVAALLKLSRLDAGVVEFEHKDIELDSLLEQVQESMELRAEWKQIRLVTKGRKGIVLCGDAKWLGEALNNIVKNAIEHSPEREEVELITEENAVYAAISVKDHGKGIPPEEQKHIFERFYRKELSGQGNSDRSKTHRSGSNVLRPYGIEDNVGIGLALAKEIVTSQNGTLTVSSDEEHGTVFTMRFLKENQNFS